MAILDKPVNVTQGGYEGLSEFRAETWHPAKLGVLEAIMC